LEAGMDLAKNEKKVACFFSWTTKRTTLVTESWIIHGVAHGVRAQKARFCNFRSPAIGMLCHAITKIMIDK